MFNSLADLLRQSNDQNGASAGSGGPSLLPLFEYLSTHSPGVGPQRGSSKPSHNGGGGGSSTTPYTTFSTSGSSGGEWSGISFSSAEGYWYPPDNAVAVNNAASGSQTVVSSENGAVRIDTFSGGTISASTQIGWNTLFGTPASGFFYTDPRIIDDAQNADFIIGVDDVNPNTGQSSFVYAVSSSSAPTSFSSGWTVHTVDTTSNGTWSDQPLVALNNGDLYVTTNQYDTSGNYQGDNITIITNYGSSSPTVTQTALDAPSYQPATIADGTSSTQYFVSHNATQLEVIGMNGTTETSSVTISGMPDWGNYTLGQLGTHDALDAGDGRVTSAVYDAGHNLLYAVFETADSSGTATDELVQIDMATGKVVDTLQLNSLLSNSGSTAGAGTFNASVAVDASGDVLVNFNVSGPNMYPADYYAIWNASNGAAPTPTASNYSTLYDYQNSAAAYIDPNHDLVGRWGDYSSAIADPSTSNGFFISNEFDNGSTKIYGHNFSSWGTVLANVTVTQPVA